MELPHRKRALSVCAGVVLLALIASPGFASAAASSPAVQPATGVPSAASAPSSTTFDLAEVGYQASEAFVSGTAQSYHPMLASPFTADGVWSVEPDATAAAYKTRVQVYRPSDPSRFNGTVFVEWLNVTNQADSAPDWLAAHTEMIREGAAYVGVTAQQVGVNAAVALEPSRYGPSGAGLVHPGDSYSYDIFSQAGQAVRDSALALLGGLVPQDVIAMGESQSASRMVTYIDAVHPLVHVYDGFMVHSRGTTGSPLRNNPPGTITVPGPTLIRSDLDVPVFVVQTETDTRATRQPDTPVFRQWEIAGTAHADLYTLGIGQVDTGKGNAAAVALLDGMLSPVSDPLPGILPPCSLGVNAGPHHWVFSAAVHWLELWVSEGTPPPSGGPGLTTTGGPTGPLVLDAQGNVRGGVRSPHVDVPVATIRGTGNSAPGPVNFCGLFGTTTAFSSTQMRSLYRNHGAYVSAWNASVRDGVAAGFILPDDAAALRTASAQSDVGKR